VSFTHQIAESVNVFLAQTISSPIQILSVCAAAVGVGFTISSGFVKTMVPLRWFGVLSNIGFLTYGILFPNWVMVLMRASAHASWATKACASAARFTPNGTEPA